MKFFVYQSETDSTSNVLRVNSNLVEVTDFDCVLCYRTLWKPVVTPCGHTYCLVRCSSHFRFDGVEFN